LAELQDEATINGSNSTETQDATNEEIEKTISTIVSKTSEQALKNLKAHKQGIVEFNKNLKNLLQFVEKKKHSISLPLFVIVDELDR
jgi:hypothetical protein